MKKIIPILILLFAIGFNTSAQNCGTIKIYRSWRFSASGLKYGIIINDKEVVQLPNNSKLTYYTNEGTYSISLIAKNGDGVGRSDEFVLKNRKTINDIVYIKLNPNKWYTLQQVPSIDGRVEFDKIPEKKHITINVFKSNIIKNTDNTPPQITIIYPNITRGFKPVEQQNQVTITGKATDASGIFEILINGEPASVDAQGNFSKTVLLAFGNNSFTVKATDIKQNTATETFVIERKSNQQDVVVANNQTNNSNNLQTGKYYALIIGNNNYSNPAINSLDEPINDATKLYNALTSEYTFEPQDVTFIKNATYVQMIEAFDDLSNTLTENDNLLVFYAGHGWWDEDKNLGYWLPTDARKSSTAFWIGNSRISDYMSSIKSKHTLLIADACFSGSIFKTRSAFSDAQPAINKLYELPSKTAMTSGNLKEVPDKSVFLQYLVKRLNDNTEKYISADQLFASFRIAVMNNSTTEPQFGTIQNAGDEGGEFIFIRK